MQKLAAFLKRFHSGPAADAYEYLGCHMHEDGEGYVFRVWAPRAKAVSVVGDFNSWIPSATPMKNIDPQGGIWERFVPGIRQLFRSCAFLRRKQIGRASCRERV